MTMKTTVAKPDSRGPAATAQTALTEKNGSPSQPSEREYYCLQRFDRCDLTPEKLLFAASIKAGRMAVGDPVLLGNGDWIGGGRFETPYIWNRFATYPTSARSPSRLKLKVCLKSKLCAPAQNAAARQFRVSFSTRAPPSQDTHFPSAQSPPFRKIPDCFGT